MKLRTTPSSLLVPLFLLLSAVSHAQFTASGLITDNEGTSVIGASILIEGTSTGTVTDIDGLFTLDIPRNQATLIVSYTGFGSQTFDITSQNPYLEIELSPSAELLQEVVVVDNGYGSQDLSTFSGAATKVLPENFANVPRTNFQESLAGNVAGLQVSQGSGQPGAFQSVQIRGLGSINASSSPLYVIDGIPVFTGNVGNESTTSTPLAGLNPQDIEDIQVLKDASATAIYGSRGANGVIVITTKKGKAGATRVDVNVQSGFSNVSLADKIRPLNSSEYLELIREGLINAGDAADVAEANEIIADRIDDPSVDTDWFDAITQQGSFTNANVSASGGTDQSRYFLSAGYQNNDGTIIGTGFERYSSRLNLTSDMTDWFQLNLNTSLSYTDQRTVADAGAFANPVRSIFRFVPVEPVYEEDGSYNIGINSGYNPVGESTLNKRKSNILNLLGSISAVVDLPFIDGLTYEPFFSYNSIRGSDETFFIPDFGTGASSNGYAESDHDMRNNWMARNMLKYRQRFNDAHGIDLTLGMEAQQFDRDFTQATSENFAFPSLTTLDNGSNPVGAGQSKTTNSLVGYFFMGNYNYKGLVYANGTYRRDGSSRFGADNRYANFYSFGVGINLERFDFLAGNRIINQLRLRSSYGQNGNQAGIGNFASRGLYGTGDDYMGNPGILLDQLANSMLTWEVNKPFNVGMDLGLFNRVSLTVDLYSRRTSSLLFERPVSRVNGVSEINSNIGELENRGIEVSLETQNVLSPSNGFTWTTSFNITRNRNEVIALPEGDFADGSYYRAVGQPWNTWYMRGYANVNPETGEPRWYIDETEAETTTEYNDAELYEHGAADPSFYGGMRNTFSFKGVSLAVQLNYNWGSQILHVWSSYTHTDGQRGFSTTGNLARSIYNRRWQQPGDVTDTPQFILGDNRSSQSRSTRFLYDGSYLSIRDVVLSYSLPASLRNPLKMGNVRVFAQASNLAIFTKDDRLERDPRTDSDGQIDQEIPIPRTVTFGLDLSF
ncbi:SusC/RagA family TonB-linked outer membrane protein [Lewinella sp. IMCC34191]|uniref:SusC/RagA family TonB-linked outer membrane protein n=1 Tax=Lewinella sp. IMCC34191 TaxID=2259172 RepID=UPI000E2573C7|nr:TonB-dependent receptor [Lewinella sp. IMCC34191]